MSLANYAEEKYASAFSVSGVTFGPPSSSIYMSLHSGDPGETATANAIASAARQLVVFNANGGTSACANATVVDFAVSSSGFVTHVALWDASSTAAGNALAYGALSASKAFNAGDTIRLSSAQLTLTFS